MKLNLFKGIVEVMIGILLSLMSTIVIIVGSSKPLIILGLLLFGLSFILLGTVNIKRSRNEYN